MELEVFKTTGEKANRNITFDDTLFSIEPNDHAIYLDVKLIMANNRQGTHKSKERSEISGTTKKFKKQKGTGGARAGDMNSPVFVGGGRAFGPRPRDYGFKLNKKVKRLARLSAMVYKIKNSDIKVIENFDLENPKTKEIISILKNLDMLNQKVLVVTSELSRNVYLSARNLGNIKVIPAMNLNTYDVLNAKKLLIFENSVQDIHQVLA